MSVPGHLIDGLRLSIDNFELRKLFGLCVLVGLPFLLGAQNPVNVQNLADSTDSLEKGAEQGPFLSGQASRQPSEFETQYQIQILQQEVLELRGLIEQLNHELAEMKRLQENRYLDVDSRLQALGDDSRGSSAVIPAFPTDRNNEGVLGPESSGITSEEGLYESALARIRIRDYDSAIADLKKLIETFPEGTFAPNAYYWLGEVYAAKPEPAYEKARQALAQVISFFPDHRKVPDAAFKLGKVYHLMGDCDRARELMENVVEKYKGKSVSRLADNYLREKLRDKINCK